MNEPFERTHLTDKPAIVGARWWQESMAIAGDPVARRQALQAISIMGASILGVGIIGAVAGSAGDDTRVEKRDALAMQRDYGWNFGAETEALTFDGSTYARYDNKAILSLVNDLTPTSAALRPYYIPTLFQSLLSTPRVTLPEATPGAKALHSVLVPIQTPAMREAYRQGKALATLFQGASDDCAVLVDLDGPLAVAFAAGASSLFEPVFAFDNWPHPLGVVPAHLTLAAVAHYQPLFVKNKGSRPASRVPPLFVLDRGRLNPYSSENTQFDNRYLARVPTGPNLLALGDRKLLYVVPSASYNREADDLNADFVAYGKSGIDVRMIAASDLTPEAGPTAAPPGVPADDWPPYYYGGSAESHHGFWTESGWGPPPRPAPRAPSGTSGLVKAYRPTPRSTQYNSAGTGMSKTRPSTMGTMPVVVAATSGLIVGAAVSRSGSFGRYSSSWGGG
ncbi:MAG: hypothetical protein MUF64_19920 [Polyangiaceae bacterium]|jgi:hypothetical protein|nr:hypothetical protein [Polyangiaceae bacterium]